MEARRGLNYVSSKPFRSTYQDLASKLKNKMRTGDVIEFIGSKPAQHIQGSGFNSSYRKNTNKTKGQQDAQQVKALTAKCDDLSSTPRIHRVEERTGSQGLSSDLYMCIV